MDRTGPLIHRQNSCLPLSGATSARLLHLCAAGSSTEQVLYPPLSTLLVLGAQLQLPADAETQIGGN